jgi:hypothetical protein
MDTGYDPERVHSLLRHTLESIDRLDALASPDPAAADAVRAVRLARANLEDLWMPALRDIERGAPMARWRRSRLGSFGFRPLSDMARSMPAHLRPGSPTAATIQPRRRDELLGRLDWLERKSVNGDTGTGAPTEQELADLAEDVSFWVRRDDGFASEIVGRATSNMTVARLLGTGRFPSTFGGEIVRRMALPNGPDNGVDRDRYATSLGIALDSLVDEPDACLDLLLDRHTTHALATWVHLDPVPLASFVTSGLLTAVQRDAERLVHGYEVVRFLTALTNGPLDGGMSAGMAVGVASALPAYLDTLAPAIHGEGDAPVTVRRVHPEVELGTYDDVVDLVGSLVRVPEAAGQLGRVFAAYTSAVFERLGGTAPSRSEVGQVVEFADLLRDARRNERGELLLAAAADEARHRQLGSLVDSAANLLLLAGGVGATARAAVNLAFDTAAAQLAPARADEIPRARDVLGPFDLITVAAITAVATDPAARSAAGLGSVTPQEWVEIKRRLDDIDRANGARSRTDAAQGLYDWIDDEAPALSAYLFELHKAPGLHDLRESDDEARPDT